MYISEIKSQYGRDIYGTFKCEHCGGTYRMIGGYDDHNYHENVVPAIHCSSCGKNRAGEVKPVPKEI